MGSLVLEDKSDLISWMGMGGFRHSKYTIHWWHNNSVIFHGTKAELLLYHNMAWTQHIQENKITENYGQFLEEDDNYKKYRFS